MTTDGLLALANIVIAQESICGFCGADRCIRCDGCLTDHNEDPVCSCPETPGNPGIPAHKYADGEKRTLADGIIAQAAEISRLRGELQAEMQASKEYMAIIAKMEAETSLARAEIERLQADIDEAIVIAEHPVVSSLRELAQELAHRAVRITDLERQLATACHFKAGDKGDFDWAVLDQIDGSEKRIAELERALAAEREEIANLAEKGWLFWGSSRDLAAAIRARGETQRAEGG